MSAVAVGVLPDGTPVIVSGDGYEGDGTVQVWRLADGAVVTEPLRLPASVTDVVVYGTTIITTAGNDLAAHTLLGADHRGA